MIDRARELVNAGRPREAVEAYARWVRTVPGDAAAHAELGDVLAHLGDWANAARAYAAAVNADARTVGAWLGLDRALARVPRSRMSAPTRLALLTAVRDELVDPMQIHHVLALAVQTALEDGASAADPEAAAGARSAAEIDDVALALLARVRVIGDGVETALRRLRAGLLARAVADDAQPPAARTALAEALALQAHLAEHVWASGDLERAQVAVLDERLAALARADERAWFQVAVLASYRPLDPRRHAGAWAGRASHPLVRAHVDEPRRERALSASVPRHGAITDPTSRRVRAQYEAAPYPRWAYVPDLRSPAYARVPLARSGRLRDHPSPRILVAGCGTGRHAITVAMLYPRARVLAIDLSLASLGYARRKAEAHRLDNLRFAQADLLDVAALPGGPFDGIECVGVLHHLASPLDGWRALLGGLAPEGVMRVGLYSTAARAALVAARRELGGALAAPGADRAASDDEVRALREAVRARGAEPAMRVVTRWPDFYALSECRDLLFPAAERTFSLPEVARAIDELGLALLDFAAPDDRAPRLDLAAWEEKERADPLLFAGMYQFWVGRRGSV